MVGGATMKEHKLLVDWVKEYVSHRRNLGYRLEVDEGQLLLFAKYAENKGHHGPLTTALCLSWVQQVENTNTRHRRFATVHSFAKYLVIFEPQTEIPSRAGLGLRCCRPQPYIYSAMEIAELLQACDELKPHGGFRSRTYMTLFGLIAASGLRISEALKLRYDDVDLDRAVLTIRETKFRKSRLIPVHTSTRDALRKYLELRDNYHQIPKSEWFFVSATGSALPYPTVIRVFQKLRQRLGWDCSDGKKLPRIHDLRHTFTCRRILGWYEEDVNVNQAIPFLSAYLGHGKVTDTYWYLTGIPELMTITAERFERFAVAERGKL